MPKQPLELTTTLKVQAADGRNGYEITSTPEGVTIRWRGWHPRPASIADLRAALDVLDHDHV